MYFGVELAKRWMYLFHSRPSQALACVSRRIGLVSLAFRLFPVSHFGLGLFFKIRHSISFAGRQDAIERVEVVQ